MPDTSHRKIKKISLLAGSGIVLLLLALVLVVFPSHQKQQNSNDLVRTPSQAQRPGSSLAENGNENADGRQIPSPRYKPSTEVKGNAPEIIDTSPIEFILNNQELSFEETATRLLECTRQDNLPMEVRLSALDHAFNLDRWQSLTLCMEKPLPSPIAERLLSGIHNLNESPKDQVSACMHLIEHEDAEIREQAQELLAFLVSAEEHATEPEKLREAADAFLTQPDERGEEVSGQ